MFPSYFFVSVLYHYLCYYSIYKMHKNSLFTLEIYENAVLFSHQTFTKSDIITQIKLEEELLEKEKKIDNYKKNRYNKS